MKPLSNAVRVPFAAIEEVAITRAGSESRLLSLLRNHIVQPQQIMVHGDRYLLSEMTKTIFQVGFNWDLVRKKWPAFESAFWGFDVERCASISESDFHALCSDKRLIRNAKKISSVRKNAAMILNVEPQDATFASLIANWPNNDFVGLLEYLGNHGAMLGLKTAQYFLRHAGKDGFLINSDGASALKQFNVVASTPTSLAHFKNLQFVFNQWMAETGYGLAKLSQILALSADNKPHTNQRLTAPTTKKSAAKQI